ncbi:MAG: hypothetical protein JSS60_05295 [Verrucomicrobia bacterium]|nr:hypothetical protein [Verrucomicrobiota bacterium]
MSGIYEIGINAASGALAGYAFSLIDPIGGAIFGATSALSHTIATSLADRFAFNQTAVKIAVWAVSFVASVGLGLLAATVAGFPLTVMGAVGMTLAMLVTSLVVRIVSGGMLCCSGCAAACVGGAALAAKEKFC